MSVVVSVGMPQIVPVESFDLCLPQCPLEPVAARPAESLALDGADNRAGTVATCMEGEQCGESDRISLHVPSLAVLIARNG